MPHIKGESPIFAYMKFIILLAVLYVAYRYWNRKNSPKPIHRGNERLYQEEDEYIDYEEVDEDDDNNS